MSNFQSVLKSLRTSKMLTQEDLAKALKISRSTVGMYENGSREPGHEMLETIADFFNVDIDYLLGRTYKTTVLPTQLHASAATPEEFEHIKKYRNLDDRGKSHVDSVLDWETERMVEQKQLSNHIVELKTDSSQEESTSRKTRLINYYYRLASAGTGQIIFDMPPSKRVEIPDIPKYRKVDYAIGVNGNSMEPEYYDGDMLLIEMAEEINPGEIGIFIVDGESYVKKLGKGKLISLNPEYVNIPLDENSRCMGRVVDKL